MDPQQATTHKVASRHRLLMRGESAVASVGIFLAAILLAAMAGSAWWALRTQRVSAESARAQQIESVGTLLAHSSEAMLAGNDLSSVRRLIVETGRQYDLSRCRIVLPGGQVLADADPSRITSPTMPVTWPQAKDAVPDQMQSARTADGALSLSYPVIIAGRGEAQLEMTANLSQPMSSLLQTQTGAGAIGAASLLALMLVYRYMRSRLRAIGAIREALLAMVAGEGSPAALVVSEDLGAEAKAWNAVLTERDELRKQAAAQRAQQSLGSRRTSSSGLDGACDAMSQGIILVDDKLRVRYANGAAAVFLRTRRDDLINADAGQAIADAKVLASVRGAADGSVRQRVTIEIERDDEDAKGLFRFCVRPVRRDDSAAAMIVIEDITQQRVAEEARHAFVAQATHELRTPLTNIRLYVETALDEGQDDPAVRADCLNVINQEARRLERIVGDMLSVAEIEAGSLKLTHDDVRVKEVFEQLHNDYQALANEKQIALTFELPPKLPVIQGDRDKITMALHNLIGNALKYTPDGGQVTVTVETTEGQVTVDVVDTGIGIDKDDIERIFEKFYRAKDRRIAKITGSGLGLALAREVVRLHGGDIIVESEFNKGSRFTLTLPAAEAA